MWADRDTLNRLTIHPLHAAGSLPSIGRRLLLAIVALVLFQLLQALDAAAQASSSATPDPCAGAPASPAAYEAAFTGLARSGTGWATADGYVPVPLPDGRTAWLMSDTLLAPPAVGATAAATFVHNSIVVQRGRCFTARLGGPVGSEQDLVPQDEGRACWQSAGVARGQTLIVFCTEVEATDGPPGFGFRVVGSALATFALPSLTFTGLAPLPFAEVGGVAWGTGALLGGDTVYVYGTSAGHAYVARVPFARRHVGTVVVLDGEHVGWAGRDRADDVYRRHAGKSRVRHPIGSRVRRGRIPSLAPRPEDRGLDVRTPVRTVAFEGRRGFGNLARRTVRLRRARRRSRSCRVGGDLQRERSGRGGNRPNRLRRSLRPVGYERRSAPITALTMVHGWSDSLCQECRVPLRTTQSPVRRTRASRRRPPTRLRPR